MCYLSSPPLSWLPAGSKAGARPKYSRGGSRVIYSMTGYAALSRGACARHAQRRDPVRQPSLPGHAFRLPDELRSFEPGLREMVAARLTRGKVECRVGFQKSPASQVSLQLNTALLDQLVELDRRRARRICRAAASADGERRAPLAGHRRDRRACRWSSCGSSTQALMERTLEEFTAVARARRRKAQGPAARARRSAWKSWWTRVKPRIPQLVAAYQERLASRLKDALKTSGASTRTASGRSWCCSRPRSTWRKSCRA